jgi:hypothetical protein
VTAVPQRRAVLEVLQPALIDIGLNRSEAAGAFRQACPRCGLWSLKSSHNRVYAKRKDLVEMRCETCSARHLGRGYDVMRIEYCGGAYVWSRFHVRNVQGKSKGRGNTSCVRLERAVSKECTLAPVLSHHRQSTIQPIDEIWTGVQLAVLVS